MEDNAGECDFFLLGLHAKAEAILTKNELNSLDEAYEYFAVMYGTYDALILGDLNADGQYLYSAEFELLDLTQNIIGTWVHFKTPYTNTGNRPAWYDR